MFFQNCGVHSFGKKGLWLQKKVKANSLSLKFSAETTAPIWHRNPQRQGEGVLEQQDKITTCLSFLQLFWLAKPTLTKSGLAVPLLQKHNQVIFNKTINYN